MKEQTSVWLHQAPRPETRDDAREHSESASDRPATYRRVMGRPVSDHLPHLVPSRIAPRFTARAKTMNREIAQARWPSVRERLREHWSRLSSEDVETLAGDYDRLVSALQLRYGRVRDDARMEVDHFLARVARES